MGEHFAVVEEEGIEFADCGSTVDHSRLEMRSWGAAFVVYNVLVGG